MKNLIKQWQECGLKKGDVFLLHSDVRRILLKNREIKLEGILQSLLLTLKDSGTLLLPLFNFDFTKGKIFNINTTPSQMGVLSEFSRKQEGFMRSKHPVYSFAIWGKYAKEFAKLENKSAYAQNSPFGLLKELDGKIGVLDLSDVNPPALYSWGGIRFFLSKKRVSQALKFHFSTSKTQKS